MMGTTPASSECPDCRSMRAVVRLPVRNSSGAGGAPRWPLVTNVGGNSALAQVFGGMAPLDQERGFIL
jgi:hypothetical protein